MASDSFSAVERSVVWKVAPTANQLDHLGLAAESIGIDRAFMLAEKPDDGCHVGRDRRIDAEQIGDREMTAILAIPPGKQEVRDPPRLAGVGSSDLDQPVEGIARGSFTEGALVHGIRL